LGLLPCRAACRFDGLEMGVPVSRPRSFRCGVPVGDGALVGEPGLVGEVLLCLPQRAPPDRPCRGSPRTARASQTSFRSGLEGEIDRPRDFQARPLKSRAQSPSRRKRRVQTRVLQEPLSQSAVRPSPEKNLTSPVSSPEKDRGKRSRCCVLRLTVKSWSGWQGEDCLSRTRPEKRSDVCLGRGLSPWRLEP